MNNRSKVKKKYSKNPFSLFLIMMLVVIVTVSAGFSFFMFNVYNRTLRNETIKDRRTELSISEQYLENLVTSFRKQMLSMMFTRELYMWDDSTTDYEEYHEVINILNENKAKHSAIHSIYAVFEGSDVVLTSNEGYFTVEDFYDDIWKSYGTDELQMMKETNRIGISSAHLIEPRALSSANVISMVAKIQLEGGENTGEERAGYLVINLYQDVLVKNMDVDEWSSEESESELAIITDNNEIVYDSTQGMLDILSEEELETLKNDETEYLDKTVDGQVWLFQTVHFWSTDWYILRISRMTEQTISLTWAQNALIAALIVCAVSIVLVLVSLWRHVYRPYTRLLNKIKTEERVSESGEGMEYLEETIAQTLDKTEILMESYYERMLVRGTQGDTIIRIGRFQMLLMSVAEFRLGYTAASLQTTTLKNCVKQFMMEKQNLISFQECHCVGMADSQLAVLLEMKNEPQDGMESCVQMLSQYVSATINISLIIGVSSIHESANELHRAYLEAKDAMDMHYFDSVCTLFYYEKIAGIKRAFYIENSVKVDIFTNNINAMKVEEAREAFDIIVEDLRRELKNTVYYNLPSFFSRLFERVCRAIRNTGLEPVQFFNLNSEDGRILNTWDFDSMEEAVNAMYKMLDRIQAHLKQQESGNRTSKPWAKIMLDYVDQNYDKGISLSRMASDLGLDESYLSRQFKEKVGISFVQYVTKCRMDRAKELLRDPSIRQADIAAMLGMGNVQSFIRTFKKYEGITPGQYREKYISETEQ